MDNGGFSSYDDVSRAIREGSFDTRLGAIHRGDLTGGIRVGGPFSGFLFFGDDSHGTESTHPHRYHFVNACDLASTAPSRWGYDSEMQPLIAERVAEVAELLGCDEDAAHDAICDGDYDASELDDPWAVQRITCEIARAAGFAIVEFADEHGLSLAIDALDPDVAIFDERGERVGRAR